MKNENIKTINLGAHGIVIHLVLPQDENGRYGGGSIVSNLEEVCEHCGHRDCDFDCEEAMEWAQDRDHEEMERKNEELKNNRDYNNRIDGFTSLILSQAVMGIDVESPAYLEALETAEQSIGNNS